MGRKSNSEAIGELVMAILLGLAALFVMGVASKMDNELKMDPRWVSAAMETVQTVFMVYLVFWAWRIYGIMTQLAAILSGDVTGVYPSLRGIIKMFVDKLIEVSQDMQYENPDNNG